MKNSKYAIVLLAFLTCSIGGMGCNTVKGVGKDLKKGGEGIERTADKTEDKIQEKKAERKARKQQ